MYKPNGHGHKTDSKNDSAVLLGLDGLLVFKD